MVWRVLEDEATQTTFSEASLQADTDAVPVI